MGDAVALRLAINLLHFPSRVRSVRSAPLPDDVLVLLHIAAGDEEAIRAAVESVDRPCGVVQEAAAFFIEQVLFNPDADSYRVLGAKPETPYAELRRNMALLLKWLHPDRDRHGERAIFAKRVTRAWNSLKTEERRAVYDRSHHRSIGEKSPIRMSHGTRVPSHGTRPRPGRAGLFDGRVIYRRPLHNCLDHREGLLRRMMSLLFGRGAP